MESVELKAPQQDGPQKPKATKKTMSKPMRILKLIGTKTLLFAFIIAFIVGFSALFGQNVLYTGVSMVTGLLMFLKLDIGIRHKQAPFVIFGLFMLTGIAAFVAAINPWLGIAVNFITVYTILIFGGQRAEYRSFIPFLLCYIFLQSTPVHGIDFGMRMASLAAGGALIAVIYYPLHRKKPCPGIGVKEALTHSVSTLATDTNKFFLRMAIGMTIAMFIGDMIGSTRTLWLSFPVFSLTQIKPIETAHRTIYRIFATILGGVLYVTVFDFIIPPEYLNIGLLATGYIYTYITKYPLQQIFVVISALGSARTLGLDSAVAWPARVLYLLIGALIVGILLMIEHANIWKLIKNTKKSSAHGTRHVH